MNRIKLSENKYEELFGEMPNSQEELDPEFMDILRKFIFGDVFYVGNINDKLREMITVTALTVNQTLPQLKAHSKAALNIGVTPIELREIIYQCAPFIGFPKVLNSLSIINEVFSEMNIALPLEAQKTIEDEERYKRGKEIQFPIYGDAIKENMKDLPGGFGDIIPRFLTEFGFGDFYTRNGLDIKIREILILCILAALGGTEKQILSHANGNMKVGNDKEIMISAMVHCIPYIGFPRAFNAINIIKDLEE